MENFYQITRAKLATPLGWLLLLFCYCLGNNTLQAQGVEFKVQLMADSSTWGVYYNPDNYIPSNSTYVSSGQITVKVDLATSLTDFTSVNGTWRTTAPDVVAGPVEAPSFKYYSVGLDDGSTIPVDGSETLLMTFKSGTGCPDTMALIDNYTDPFNVLPNSAGNNPGNTLTVVDNDYGGSGFAFQLDWTDNYALAAWDCDDCDGDGLPNALEDTNGNGVYDPGIDFSAICDACSPTSVTAVNLGSSSDLCIDSTTTIAAVMTGGFEPYTLTVTQTDNTGSMDIVYNNYYSGDLIAVSPLRTTTYTVNTVTDSLGCEVDPGGISGDALITIEGPFTLDTDVTDLSQCAPLGIDFVTAVSNAGDGTPLFQWQISTDGGTTWADLPDGTPYNGVTTTTLEIDDVTGLDLNQYMMKIYTNSCDTAYTSPGKLTVDGPFYITDDPDDATICGHTDGHTFSMTAVNTGSGTMKRRWQVSEDDGATWTQLSNVPPYSGVGSSNLDIAFDATQRLNGNLYRTRVFSDNCADIFTQPARLTVEGPLSVTAQPQDQQNCAGSGVTFFVNIDNPQAGTVDYQWQRSTNGGMSWTNLANDGNYNGAGSDTLSIDDVAGYDGYQYRVQYGTSACATQNSETASLQVSGTISYSDQPDAFAICAGGTASFGVEASISQGAIDYKWQRSFDGGATWTDIIADSTNYSGFDTKDLTINNTAGWMDGDRFRAVVLSANCQDFPSSQAELTVEGALSVITHPSDITVCSGSGTTFAAAISNLGGGTVERQWQVKIAGGGIWVNLPNNATYNGTQSDILSISDVAGLDYYSFRMGYKTTECNTWSYTDRARVNVEGPFAIDYNPQVDTTCSGDAAQFAADFVKLGFDSLNYTYKWQSSIDTVNWSDVTDGTVYSGSATATLDVTNSAGLDQTLYRLAVTTSTCGRAYTDWAPIIVEGPISIPVGAQPEDFTTCSDDQALFGMVMQNDNSGDVFFRWQESADDGATWTNLYNDGFYNGAETDTLTIADPTGKDRYQYRVELSTATCGTVETSEVGILYLEGPLVINTQPVIEKIRCAGDTVSYEVNIDAMPSGTAVYAWEYRDSPAGTWQPLGGLAVASVTSTATKTKMDITNVIGLNDYQFRVHTNTTHCDVVTSDVASLVVEGPISITNQPDDLTVCSDELVAFEVAMANPAAGPLFYRWETRANASGTWVDVPNDPVYNGQDSPLLSVADALNLNGRQFRVQIWTGTCANLVSSVATLTVEGPVDIFDNPDDAEDCHDTNVSFSAAYSLGSSVAATVGWQESTDGGATWTDLSNNSKYNGATGTTLTITPVDFTQNENQYRFFVKLPSCARVYSAEALLNVQGPITFTDEPDDVVICSGEATSFSVAINNNGSGAATYQWQVRPDGGSWINLTSNNSIYNGFNTASLSIADVAGLDNFRFRCIVQTQYCSSITSVPGKIDVEGPFNWTAHPVDATMCSGSDTSFTAIVNNQGDGTMTYQWQTKVDGDINWANVSNSDPLYADANTTTLTVTADASINRNQYRLRTVTGVCATGTFSEPALLLVEGPLTVTQQPLGITTCSALGTTFVVNIDNPGEGSVEYQWQSSPDDLTWSNLVNSDTLNGVTSDTLSIDDVLGLDGTYFRARYWTSTCNVDASNSALITVEGPLSIDTESRDTTVCVGEDAYFEIEASNAGGSGVVAYRWELSANGGTTWQAVADDANYDDVTTDKLIVHTGNVPYLYNYQYRCVIGSGSCNELFGNPARLTLMGPVTFTNIPDQDVCSNIGTTFTTGVLNGGSGQMTMRWEVSKDDGSSWTVLNNDADYAGVTTPTLDIVLVEPEPISFHNYQYRLAIDLDVCATYYSNAATLTVSSDELGHCDWDLDGLPNDTDPDDDNDGLTDTVEVYITTYGGPEDSLYVFNPDTDGDGETDDEEDADDDTINNGEETDEDDVYEGDPVDPCDPIISIACKGVTLDIKVFLNGAMTGGTGVDPANGLMRDQLRANGLVPTTEPYSALKQFWNPALDAFKHVDTGGGETIDDPAVLAVTGADAIVDWVFIELHAANKLDSVVATRSALLQRDGDVVDVDGTSLLHFDSVQAANYYVAVRHRNHVGIMNDASSVMSPIPQVIDFTRPDSVSTIGSYAQRVYPALPFLGEFAGRASMWAGDLAADGTAVYQGGFNDVVPMMSTILTDPGNSLGVINYISYGYHNTDYNLDGRTVFQGPGNDRSEFFFHTTNAHPANVNVLFNFLIETNIP